MRIIRHFSENNILESSILTIGNFDGVHIGHQELIRKACILANEHKTLSAVITFEPHPSSVLSSKKNFRIISLRDKILALKKFGANILYLQSFTKAFAQISAEEFIENILIKYFNPKHIIIGYDFMFGKNREGNGQLLQEYLVNHKIGFSLLKPIKIEDYKVSSSLIRKLLSEGKIQESSRLLGYEYYITGIVNDQGNISEKLKLPVVEIYLNNICCPKVGVYIAIIEFNNNSYNALVNIKKKGENGARGILEIYVFNCKYKLHNRRIQVKLLKAIDSIR